MKLQIMSDLHLEFADMDAIETDADAVILAGDIDTHTHGIEWAADQPAFKGKHILYVAGNHEFYDAEFFGLQKQMQAKAEALGVHLLECDRRILSEPDGREVRILGATLWTDFRLHGSGDAFDMALAEARQWLNDFRLIKKPAGLRFLPADSLRIHQATIRWLKAQLAEPFDGKTVIVTHHAPSPKSIAPRFTGDPLSPCFASDLEDLAAKADLWIHGHTHNNADYYIGKCRVICNPRGYVRRLYDQTSAENPGFTPDLMIEI